MLKSIFAFLLLIFLTTAIVATNPQLHKEVAFSSVDFGFSSTKVKTTANIPQVKSIQNTKTTQNTNIKTVENVADKQNATVKNVDRNAYMNTLKMRYQQEQHKNVKLQAQQQPKTQPKPAKSIPVQKSTQKNVKQTAQTPTQPKQAVVNKVVTQNKNTTVPKTQPIKQAPIKQEPIKQEKQPVTQQETIVWNKWRSDIANAIGTTTTANLKETVSVGTTIKYSFNVDKNEQISNIFVSIIKGPTDTGAQSAKSAIYKAIKSLNGKSILAFPKGTNRTSTTVVGAIELSDKTVKTDKSMFNDYETITKQYYK